MNDDLLNILSHSNKDIDNQKLMDYLSDKLSAEEKHTLEKAMIDSEMMNDAMEGLDGFKNKKDVSALVEQLNINLKKQLEKKKSNKEKRSIKDLLWLYVTVILILLIILIGFFVIKHLESEKQSINSSNPVNHPVYKQKKSPGISRGILSERKFS
ncbi:MAG: hypothetical protein ABI419_02600 [Ginsengibacter sp.]